MDSLESKTQNPSSIAKRTTLLISSLSIGVILYKLQKKLNSRVRLESVVKSIKLDLKQDSRKPYLNDIQLIPLTINNDNRLNISESMFNTVKQDRDYLSEYLPWPKYIKSVQDERDFIKRLDAEMKQDYNLIYAIMNMSDNEQGQLIVTVGFNYIYWKNSVGFIGYWLSKNYQKNGIMTQSVKQLIKFGFDILKLDHIHISAAESNYKSRGIPERLNFVQYDNVMDVDSLGNKMVTYILSTKSPKISAEKSVPSYFYRDVLGK